MLTQRLPIHSTQHPLSMLDKRDNETQDECNFFWTEPEYQRGHVWSDERKERLIFSLLFRIPIGTIIVNDRVSGFAEVGERDYVYAVIDGKQRISAIHDFVDNKISIPREWITTPYGEDTVAVGAERILFEDLTEVGKRVVRSLPVPVSHTQLDTVEQEKEVFELVNFGGVAQGESDF